MKLDIETARKMVAAIEEDLCDRRGLRQEWEGIDAGTQKQIRETWVKLIQEATSDAGADEGGDEDYVPGPATRLKSALHAIAHVVEMVGKVGKGLSPATLAAMDAAAALADNGRALRLDLAPIGVCVSAAGRLVIGGLHITIMAEEELCLRLLERAIQRRQEQEAQHA